jgi:uncharacterized protein (DUF4415 family)
MSRKKEHIVRFSAAELEALKESGKTESDWSSAATKPIPDGSDPDDAIEAIDWSTTDLPTPKRKEHTNLRLDADVLEYFRAQGPGYQTRINAVLRSYVDQVRRPRPR